MNNDLLFLSGNDIPLINGNLIIHPPTLKEISLIGEEAFYTGCEFLNFSKNNLKEEEQEALKDQTNFDIILAILKNKESNKQKICFKLLLTIIFPKYEYKIQKDKIELISIDNNIEQNGIIDNSNFEELKKVLKELFCLKLNGKENEFCPAGDFAKKIAEKINRGRQKADQQKQLQGSNSNKVSILVKCASILAIGLQKDLNNLMNYTVYQIFDEFDRYQLKIAYDMNIQARMQGAKDLKEPEDWMKDIHE